MSLNLNVFNGYIYFGKDQQGNVRDYGALQTTQNGAKYVRFSLKVPKYQKNPDGTYKDPNWIDCIAWDKLAERICNPGQNNLPPMFRKGQAVIVTARYEQNKYTDNQGQNRVSHDFVAFDISTQLKDSTDQQPAQAQPQAGYGQPQQGYGQPQAGYGQPAPAAPSQVYGQPQAAPGQVYGQPAPGQVYQQPMQGQPQGYQQPAPGAPAGQVYGQPQGAPVPGQQQFGQAPPVQPQPQQPMQGQPPQGGYPPQGAPGTPDVNIPF